MVSSLRDELDIIGKSDSSVVTGTISAGGTGKIDFEIETDETAVITTISMTAERKGVFTLLIGSRGIPNKTLYTIEKGVDDWTVDYERLIFLDRTKTLRVEIKNNDTTNTSKISVNLGFTILKIRVAEMLEKKLIDKYGIDLRKG